MNSRQRAPRAACRPLASVGVIEAPRVKLGNGLFRTMEKPTSAPTARRDYGTGHSADSFIQGGRPPADGELGRQQLERGAEGRPGSTAGDSRGLYPVGFGPLAARNALFRGRPATPSIGPDAPHHEQAIGHSQ